MSHGSNNGMDGFAQRKQQKWLSFSFGRKMLPDYIAVLLRLHDIRVVFGDLEREDVIRIRRLIAAGPFELEFGVSRIGYAHFGRHTLSCWPIEHLNDEADFFDLGRFGFGRVALRYIDCA